MKGIEFLLKNIQDLIMVITLLRYMNPYTVSQRHHLSHGLEFNSLSQFFFLSFTNFPPS